MVPTSALDLTTSLRGDFFFVPAAPIFDYFGKWGVGLGWGVHSQGGGRKGSFSQNFSVYGAKKKVIQNPPPFVNQ